MSQHDARSAVRPNPDQPMVDIADYVVDYQVESREAYDTARYMLLDSLACWLGWAWHRPLPRRHSTIAGTCPVRWA